MKCPKNSKICTKDTIKLCQKGFTLHDNECTDGCPKNHFLKNKTCQQCK